MFNFYFLCSTNLKNATISIARWPRSIVLLRGTDFVDNVTKHKKTHP